VITDAGSPGDLRKIGAETLTLTGANTYSGTTVVSAGALRVDGTIVSAAGTSVEDGATLTGSGWIEGAVAVADGGTLSPGTGARLLRTGNLSLGAGATFVVDLYGTTPGITHDQVEVNGSVDLTGAVLDASLGFAATGEETFVLIDNDGVDSSPTRRRWPTPASPRP
jgi:autotransporter-associated beta strand protein